jgi:LmbE family N-acetylglucosaminyl deacetylase
MKAIAMVAHPDDCVIFAYSYIHNHPEYNWTICYLTYTELDARGKEFEKFWNSRNITTKFLGYVDDWHDIENKKISFDEDQAKKDIQETIANYDLVLTHDEYGDYGHLHHVFVNQATSGHSNRVVFAKPGSGSIKYSLENRVYSLNELPLHQEVIAGFHTNTHTNEYNLCKNI